MSRSQVKKTANKQRCVFNALANTDLVIVQPGFPVVERTIFGLHGDDSDLAISFRWRDAAGCEWEANFTEQNLLDAQVAQNCITLHDSEGENICLEMFEVKPKKL